MNLDKVKDKLAKGLQQDGVNLTRAQALDQKRCVQCGADATEFKDSVSKTEYSLTVWCQECQDKFFG